MSYFYINELFVRVEFYVKNEATDGELYKSNAMWVISSSSLAKILRVRLNLGLIPSDTRGGGASKHGFTRECVKNVFGENISPPQAKKDIKRMLFYM